MKDQGVSLAGIRARVAASAIAVAAGWAAAAAVTLPMQWFRMCGNADGGLRPMPYSLAAGALVWLGWTLAIACGAWALAGLPAAVLLPHSWLAQHRRWFVAASASLAWVVVLIRFETWKLLIPGHGLSPWLFSLYSLLLVVFAWVTAVAYPRLLERRDNLPPGELALRSQDETAAVSHPPS
jgi:hypothetical protein